MEKINEEFDEIKFEEESEEQNSPDCCGSVGFRLRHHWDSFGILGQVPS